MGADYFVTARIVVEAISGEKLLSACSNIFAPYNFGTVTYLSVSLHPKLFKIPGHLGEICIKICPSRVVVIVKWSQVLGFVEKCTDVLVYNVVVKPISVCEEILFYINPWSGVWTPFLEFWVCNDNYFSGVVFHQYLTSL